jgi:hypothetical protein
MTKTSENGYHFRLNPSLACDMAAEMTAYSIGCWQTYTRTLEQESVPNDNKECEERTRKGWGERAMRDRPSYAFMCHTVSALSSAGCQSTASASTITMPVI